MYRSMDNTTVHWVVLSCDDIVEQVFKEAAFSISISSSVFIFLCLFSRCIVDKLIEWDDGETWK
jgi:hypothetical protein